MSSIGPSIIVKSLFEEARRKRIPFKAIGPLTHYSETAVRYWKQDRSRPSIAAVEAFADILGMELRLVPKQEGK